jgi:hypothetical protein
LILESGGNESGRFRLGRKALMVNEACAAD